MLDKSINIKILVKGNERLQQEMKKLYLQCLWADLAMNPQKKWKRFAAELRSRRPDYYNKG